MTIEEVDFRLIPATNTGADSWDLELLYTIRPKDKPSRQEFKIAGYGISLDYAIKKIINFRIENKTLDGVLTLKEYRKAFKEEFDIIKNILS